MEELSAVLLRLRFFSLYCLIELGDSAPRAIAVGESLTADLGRVLGSGHPDTLTAQNNLAAAYRDAGRFGEAIPLFERTLAAREPDYERRPSRYPHLAAQPRGRVPGRGPVWRGDPAVPADPGGAGTDFWVRPIPAP